MAKILAPFLRNMLVSVITSYSIHYTKLYDFSTSRVVMVCFMGMAVIASALTYEGLLSILGCGGSLFGTVASFSKDDKLLRQLMLIGTSLWLVHNILAGSPGAVVLEIFFICSNLVGYFRYYIRPAQQALS